MTDKVLKFPTRLDDKSIKKFLIESHSLDKSHQPECKDTLLVLMSFHKLIYDLKVRPRKTQKISNTGIQIIDDCGISETESSNPSGGIYDGYYRKFRVKYRSQQDIMAIGVNFNWYSKNPRTKGAQVCVISCNKYVHSLQLALSDEHCNLGTSGRFWNITHCGCRSGKYQKIDEMMNVIRKSKAKHLINNHDKKRVKLGKLYHPDDCTWQNSKDLLENLLLYGLIRYEL